MYTAISIPIYQLTGARFSNITLRGMVGRIEYLEDAHLLASHLAQIVEAELFAPLDQIAVSDEFLGDVVELLQVIHCHFACVTNTKRPLFDDTPNRAPDAKERSVSPEGRGQVGRLT